MTVTGIEMRRLPPDRERELPQTLPAAREARIQHEREVRQAYYERGREDSRAFPALLCGILIGATSVSLAVWIL
jgi:hypothetical protein